MLSWMGYDATLGPFSPEVVKVLSDINIDFSGIWVSKVWDLCGHEGRTKEYLKK